MKTFHYGLAGLALVALSAMFAWPDLSLFFASDACLGAGGSYDFDQLRCDFARPHRYVTFDLRPFWLATAGACAGLAMIGDAVTGSGLLRACP